MRQQIGPAIVVKTEKKATEQIIKNAPKNKQNISGSAHKFKTQQQQEPVDQRKNRDMTAILAAIAPARKKRFRHRKRFGYLLVFHQIHP